MENPFHYGELVSGTAFTNRVEELAELERDLRGGQNVVIMSPRRYGKTSLILMVVERLRQQGVLVAYLDLFATPTKASFAQALAKALQSGLLSTHQRTLKSVGDFFKGLSFTPKFTITEEGKPSLELTPGHSEADLDRDLEVLLALPARVAKEKGKRVVVIFDEFQEIASIDKHLPARMRTIFQHQSDVSHVYLGSKFHLMNALFNGVNQPMYKSAKTMPLHPFKADDFTPFLRERFFATGRPIDDEAIARILQITGCHPNDTQQLAHFTWALCQARDVAPDSRLVEEALTRIVSAEDAHYTLLWEELAPRQRALLIALSKQSGNIFSEHYRHQHQLGPASSIQSAVARLKERELLDVRRGEDYTITDTFLRYWIAQVALKEV